MTSRRFSKVNGADLTMSSPVAAEAEAAPKLKPDAIVAAAMPAARTALLIFRMGCFL